MPGLSVGTALALGWLKQPGQALVWLAVAVWLVVAAGAVRAARTGLLRAGLASRLRHGPQVHSTAMKMFTMVSRPTSPKTRLSTFSSSRWT